MGSRIHVVGLAAALLVTPTLLKAEILPRAVEGASEQAGGFDRLFGGPSLEGTREAVPQVASRAFDPAYDQPAEVEAAPVTPEVEPAPVPDMGCITGCDLSGCSRGSTAGCGGCAAGAKQPILKMPQLPFLARHGIKAGGWVQQSITFNADGPPSGFNGPVATNDRDAEYQLNQAWLYFDKQVDTGGSGLGWGGHLDLIYGTDWRYGINYGLEDRINSFREWYGLVIPQAYLELGVNRLKVKLGHFAGLLSYEQVPAVLNFFYSHSYSMGYSEPLLVTGLMADYQLADQLSLQGGFHRGWMMWEDTNDSLDFMGGIQWTSCDKRSSLGFHVDAGSDVDLPTSAMPGDQERFVYSLLWQHAFGEKLKWVLQHNYGVQNNTPMPQTNSNETVDWASVVNYLFYEINPRWSAGLRFEWFRDDDGARIAGLGNLLPGRGWPAAPGFEGDFYELSVGVNWRPRPNIVFRPELRLDWYNGSDNLTGDRPFNDGTKDTQFLFGTDMIVTF